jgi:membrane-associated phospholipid phosphatase
MIDLIEPMWGQTLLLWMHQVMQYPFFFERLPFVADIFVFVYPMYLVVLYGYGMFQGYKGLKVQSFALKESAVWIFVVAMASMIFNMIVQVFLVKDRPDVMLDLLYQKREDLILYDYLPKASFPSDHATMSMAIAMATLLYGLRYKKK